MGGCCPDPFYRADRLFCHRIPDRKKTRQTRYLIKLKAQPRLRHNIKKKPYLTDQKNYILDAEFGVIKDPEGLNSNLNQRAGIIEHGLFVEMVTDVISAGAKGNSHLKRYDLL